MLVLHPSSRCDVCLDDYTWVSPTNSPHAISCGHIFCLTCLRALHPSTCPLCRKNFQPDRVKKLHVDKAPDEPDGTNVLLDSHSAVLLQRIALVSGENAPDEDVLEVLNDVTEWLSTQSNDLSSNRPLQAAVRALNRYRSSQQALAAKRTECTNLKKDYTSLQRSVDHEMDTAKAIERGLLAKLDEVEAEYNAKHSATEAQVASLQNELLRYRNTQNPLPHPPQPLPLDRFPGLAQQLTSDSTASSRAANRHSQRAANGYGHHDDHGRKHDSHGAPYSNAGPSLDHIANGSTPYASRAHTTNGNGRRDTSQNRTANGSAHPLPHPMFVPDATTSGVDQTEHTRSGRRSKRPMDYGTADGRVPVNGSGSSRGQSAQTSQRYPYVQDEGGPGRSNNAQASQLQPQNQYPYIQSELAGIGGSARVLEQPANNNRTRIIPGASPTRRVIPPLVPPPPKFMQNRIRQDLGEPERESQERPRDRQSRRHRHDDRRRSFQGIDDLATRAPEQSRGMAIASFSDGEDDVESRLVSASAFVAGYGSGYEEGYGYSSAYNLGYMTPRQDGYAARRPDSSVGGLGLLGVPRNTVVAGIVSQGHSNNLDDLTTPRSRHAEPHRRRAASSSSDWGSTSLLTVPPSGGVRSGSHRTLDQVLRNDGEVHPREARLDDRNVMEVRQHNAGRNSMNSVNSSASSWGTVETSVRGSMSDLGLIGLHRGGGVRGEGSVAEGSRSTPMFGQDLENDDEVDDESATPMMSTFRVRPVPLGFQPESRAARPRVYAPDDGRPRHVRSVSHPEVPLTLGETHDRPDSRRDDDAIRPPHSRQRSLTQSISLDSGNVPSPIYGSQPTSNALNLTFDPVVPIAADTTGSTHEHIRAPAPRMGGPNVLNLWRSVEV